MVIWLLTGLDSNRSAEKNQRSGRVKVEKVIGALNKIRLELNTYREKTISKVLATRLNWTCQVAENRVDV